MRLYELCIYDSHATAHIYATCQPVLYAPARTAGRYVERTLEHTQTLAQCRQSGRHYEWQERHETPDFLRGCCNSRLKIVHS